MKLVVFSILITAVVSTVYASDTLQQPQQSTPILPGPTTLAMHPKATGQARREKAPLDIIWDSNVKRNAFDDGPLPGENSGAPPVNKRNAYQYGPLPGENSGGP